MTATEWRKEILCTAKSTFEGPSWLHVRRRNIVQRPTAAERQAGPWAYQMAVACSICVNFIGEGFQATVHGWWQYVIADQQQQQQLNTAISLTLNHSNSHRPIRASKIIFRPHISPSFIVSVSQPAVSQTFSVGHTNNFSPTFFFPSFHLPNSFLGFH